MEIVKILRQLWKLRLLVFGLALFAVFAGVLVAYRISFPATLESRKYTVGTASTRILVDTPASQVVDVAPKGSESVGDRATLLANLMVDGDIKQAIAMRAGIDPRKLQSMSDSSVSAEPDERPSARGYILTTKVLETTSGTSLPIIEVSAQGPDGVAAQRLANAAIDGLREYLDSKAAAERVPNVQRLQVSGLNRAQGRDVTRGPRNLFAIAVAIFVFIAGCALLLVMRWLISALRAPEPAPAPAATPEARHGLRAVAVPPADAAPVPGVARLRPAERQRPESAERESREVAGNWWGGGPE